MEILFIAMFLSTFAIIVVLFDLVYSYEYPLKERNHKWAYTLKHRVSYARTILTWLLLTLFLWVMIHGTASVVETVK